MIDQMFDNEVFNDSYERIFGRNISTSKNGDDFFDYFYWSFINSSPEVEYAFRNTDMDNQKSMLKKSLMYAVNFSACGQDFSYMEAIAKSHSKAEKNIDPKLYDFWLDSMVVAVKKFDPEFNDNIELAWRLALDHAITYMKYMHSR